MENPNLDERVRKKLKGLFKKSDTQIQKFTTDFMINHPVMLRAAVELIETNEEVRTDFADADDLSSMSISEEEGSDENKTEAQFLDDWITAATAKRKLSASQQTKVTPKRRKKNPTIVDEDEDNNEEDNREEDNEEYEDDTPFERPPRQKERLQQRRKNIDSNENVVRFNLPNRIPFNNSQDVRQPLKFVVRTFPYDFYSEKDTGVPNIKSPSIKFEAINSVAEFRFNRLGEEVTETYKKITKDNLKGTLEKQCLVKEIPKINRPKISPEISAVILNSGDTETPVLIDAKKLLQDNISLRFVRDYFQGIEYAVTSLAFCHTTPPIKADIDKVAKAILDLSDPCCIFLELPNDKYALVIVDVLHVTLVSDFVIDDTEPRVLKFWEILKACMSRHEFDNLEVIHKLQENQENREGFLNFPMYIVYWENDSWENSEEDYTERMKVFKRVLWSEWNVDNSAALCDEGYFSEYRIQKCQTDILQLIPWFTFQLEKFEFCSSSVGTSLSKNWLPGNNKWDARITSVGELEQQVLQYCNSVYGIVTEDQKYCPKSKFRGISCDINAKSLRCIYIVAFAMNATKEFIEKSTPETLALLKESLADSEKKSVRAAAEEQKKATTPEEKQEIKNRVLVAFGNYCGFFPCLFVFLVDMLISRGDVETLKQIQPNREL